MKLAKDELKEKLYICMSETRRDMIKEELSMGPLKVADAEKAQQTVAQIVKQLEKDGKIELARGEEDVI
jgi:flagellar motor switch protein FliG